MFYSKRKMIIKTFRPFIHVFLGLVIGVMLTFPFLYINYSTLTRDIFQWCHQSQQLWRNENQVLNVISTSRLSNSFQSILAIKKQFKTEKVVKRKLLLIGVMTTKNFLSTRAFTIYQTWARDLNGNFIFFTSDYSILNSSLPCITLPKVDDSYPPQKKSFLMLKFMYDHFGKNYHFFMRADDDVFVNVEKLHDFLSNLNSSDQLYIGQTGVGKPEESGQLNLDVHDNFCMGGPGVILSYKTLEIIGKNVQYCLKNLFSTHEDVEIGRCIRKFSGVSCSWSYDMLSLFYHNTSIQDLILSGVFPTKEFHHALTIHPIKNQMAMRKLYYYSKFFSLRKLRFRINKTYESLCQLLKSFNLMDITKFDFFKNFFQESHMFENSSFNDNGFSFNSLIWNFFSQKLYTESSINPRKNIDSHLIQAFNQNIEDIMSYVNRNFIKKRKKFRYNSLYQGYVRFSNLFGVEYILDTLIVYQRYAKKRITLPLRRRIHARQTFDQTQVEEFKFENDMEYVHVVVPLAGRLSTFKRFLGNFFNVAKNDSFLTLTVILFSTNKEKNGTFFHEADQVLTESMIRKFVKVNVLKVEDKFSRSIALQHSSSLFCNKSLLFFLDVDMSFDSHVFSRVRRNTIFTRQTYFPIVFSQYSNFLKISNQTDVNAGYWRQFGFGIVSLFKQDLLEVGGFDTTIEGWGIEDVDFYDRIIASNLTVFRAVDSGLVHVYHDIHCDPNLSPLQFEMCLGTKFTSLDSVENMANFINDNQLLH